MSPTTTIDEECPVNTSLLTIFSHTGTHVDAPFHFDAQGAKIHELDLKALIGYCTVIDVSYKKDKFTVDDIKNLDIKIFDRILFKTYSSFPKDSWDRHFMSVDAAVVSYLADRGCRLLGTDSASVDPQESKSLKAHHMTAQRDMYILEGIVLDQVEAGEYELIALPLPFEGGDASPVRAILREI